MSKIKINDLKNINVKPSDAESFLNSLEDKELQITGGILPAFAVACCNCPPC